MTINFEQKRLEAIKADAGLTEVDFPACCLSCNNYEENIQECPVLGIHINNPFQICNYYSD